MVGSEKPEGDDESCEKCVEAGFMAYGRCCGIVVDGNCSRHNFSTGEQCESRRPTHACEPVAAKPISRKAKRVISSRESKMFMNLVVLGCVRPPTNRVVVMRAWRPISWSVSPVHAGLVTVKTRKKTRPRLKILNPNPLMESLKPEKTLRTRKYDRADLNLRLR